MRIVSLLLFLFASISCKHSSDNKKHSVSEIENRITVLYQKVLDDSLAPTKRKLYVNKALKLAKNQDSVKTALLYSKCNLHFLLGEYDSLFYFGNKLTKYVDKTNKKIIRGKYFHLLAYYYSNIKSNLDSAYYYHNLAKNDFILGRDSLRVGRRLLQMGIIQHQKNDFFGSKETLTEALLYLGTIENKKYIASVFNELAINHRKLFNHADAVLYYKKAIKQSLDTKHELIFKNNLAAAYVDFKEYEKANELFSEIILEKTLKKSSSLYARILDNLTYTQWLTNKNIKNHHFFDALKIRKKNNDKRGQIASHTHLGEYFSKTHPKKAKKYLDTVIQLSRQLKIPKAETDALHFLMALEPKNTDFKDRYIFLKDSMYSQELKVKTQFAKMKYDDEQEKEKIIALESEAVQKRADLAEQKVQKILSWTISGALLLGAGLLQFFLSQRHRKERLKEVYETEKRIARKVHDELANKVYGLMASVQNTNQLTNNELLDSLEHIYRKTRDISHEMGDIDTANFNVVLKELLRHYQNEHTTITVKGLDPNLWDNLKDYKLVVIYRVINEFMVNMTKHSGASLVAMHFTLKNNRIEIRYKDNGKGFKTKNYGTGLRNTENRIHSINGRLSLDLEYGKGAKITITFPV